MFYFKINVQNSRRLKKSSYIWCGFNFLWYRKLNRLTNHSATEQDKSGRKMDNIYYKKERELQTSVFKKHKKKQTYL